MRSSPRLKVVCSALAVFALTLGVEGNLSSLNQALFGEPIVSSTHGAKRSALVPLPPVPTTDYRLPTTDFPPITLVAFGDLMLDRFVWTLMQRHGLDYPFEHFPELLTDMGVSPPGDLPSVPTTDYPLPATDFLLANLEGPISDTPYVNPGTAMVFNFRPDVIPILQKYGFNLFSIANNHNYDMGEKGVRQTRERLSEAGIHWVGESKGIAAESQWTVAVKGTTLTFFAFNDTLQDRLDFDQAAALIREAEQGSEGRPGADFTIVSIHWGVEYNQAPTQKQVENAHKLVDAGADIILGHHPHVIQKPANLTPNEHGTMFAEWYSPRIPSPLQTTDYPLQTSPRPIYYSLGNFVFDQYFSKAVQEGLGLTITLQKSTDPTVPATLQVKETVFDIVRSQPKTRK